MNMKLKNCAWAHSAAKKCWRANTATKKHQLKRTQFLILFKSSSPQRPSRAAAWKIYYLHDAWAKNNRHRSSRSPPRWPFVSGGRRIYHCHHTHRGTNTRALMLSLCPHLTRWAHRNKIAKRRRWRLATKGITLYLIIRYKNKRSHGCMRSKSQSKSDPKRARSPAPSRQRLFFTSLISPLTNRPSDRFKKMRSQRGRVD